MVSIQEINEFIADNQYRKMKPVEILYLSRISDMSDCWIVTNRMAGTQKYPSVDINGHRTELSRLVKFIEGYDLAPGLTASHLCENESDLLSRLCINPDHIILESIGDNVKRDPKRKKFWADIKAGVRLGPYKYRTYTKPAIAYARVYIEH